MAKGRQIALTPLDCACGWVSAGDDVLFLHTEACDAQFHFVTGFQVGFGCLAHAHTWGVPVEITSPGCSDMNWLRCEITVATSKCIVWVEPS